MIYNKEKIHKLNVRIAEITNGLTQESEHLWSSEISAKCAYPKDGQNRYFAVEDDSFWFGHRNNCVIEVLKRFPPNGFILDVGGGNGFLTLGLAKAGFDAILLEPNRKAVDNAMARALGPIICSTLEDVGFNSQTVPAIGLFDVLEHMADDIAFLKSSRKFLSPDGRLYLTVPAYQMLWSLDDEWAEHYRRYNSKLLAKTLCQSGYVIDYMTFFFSYLPIPLFFMKMLRSKSLFAKMNTDEDCHREHTPKSKIVKIALSVFQKIELAAIRRGITMPVGSSLLAVARPKDEK